MIPSTPPRVGHRRNSIKTPTAVFNGKMIPSTPQRGMSETPVTPSTVQPFKQPPLLFDNKLPNLSNNDTKSPFKGLKSPEYTPRNKTSTNVTRQKRNLTASLEAAKPLELSHVSRVLFQDDTHPTTTSFLAPPHNLFDILQDEEDAELQEEAATVLEEELIFFQPTTRSKKLSKTVPGTPSHRITTFEITKNLIYPEPSSLDFSSDEEDENDDGLIQKKALENPFISAKVISKEELLIRKNQLLEENPDIENVITYLNKDGVVIKKNY
ncbi:hypothetical protein TBLA_0D02330 [Henningerozyma blattae CBS 6284]|uniref:Uncharacterized protein n=1 Tax=Henningerozyma blattae (strain ATCC 34711 / CBS 6284 / DSM 70876 / NBRC 10599 / NRRL Y-10934 / UCD 77-7) TaxID=1071380 RepID=I2H2Y5_HENB6|nr:hypothetical protein TBLA_0D02330 [Tetrapisispora blattae CBS 6284]CCH60737.1 hypothetical protein TBLA_0D02330 [Tetrapisispora blattae CBS 6284]